MKILPKIITICLMISANGIAYSQTNTDSLGLPGDNLDLAAVLNIFKQSNSVEEFEKKLNAADTKVNNLDLNHDGQVDYIRVIESGKNNTHELVLQVPVSKSESQDVAVIELEKKDGNLAHVQIVGDETLYGKDYIVEPQEQAQTTQSKTITTQTTQPAAKQQSQNDNEEVDDVYATPTPNTTNNNSPATVNNNYNDSPQTNVWGWPSVQYMYGPQYAFWISPWYWDYYPGWWNPWVPYGWYGYHQRMMGFGYYNYYRHSHYNHMGEIHNGYYGHRVASTYVQKTNNSLGSVYGPRHGGKQMNNQSQFNQPVRQKNGVKQEGANPKQNFTPKQQQPPIKQEQAPVIKQVPSLRYGPTKTGGVRGGGGQMGGGNMGSGGGNNGGGGNRGGGNSGGGGGRRR